MNKTLYYKVVLQKNKQLWSAWVVDHNRVRYIKDKWTSANDNAIGFLQNLYLFSELNAAKSWIADTLARYANANHEYCIYECDAIKVDVNLSMATGKAKKIKLLKKVYSTLDN